MRRGYDLTGQTFGQLSVVSMSQSGKYGRVWICRCSCGGTKEAVAARLRDGTYKSCGCLNKADGASYGKDGKQLPIYKTWADMIYRCHNPRSAKYQDWGARGIKVYKPWQDFKTFKNYVDQVLGERPKGCTIDRIDNDKGYEPENIRWASRSQQTWNRRVLRIKGRKSKYQGVSYDSKALKNKWRAAIQHKGVKIHLGQFATEEEAARAYDKKALELRGPDARLNFPK